MGMYDRDWYRDHHREQRRASERAAQFDRKRITKWTLDLTVYCLAVYGALSLLKLFIGR